MGYRYNPPCLEMVFQISTEKSVMPCIAKLFESILNNRLSSKNEVMIMIPVKLVLKAIRGVPDKY